MSKREKYTFYQWCIDNNQQDLLDRWDYEMTGFSPHDITYASAKPVYFKCPIGKHASEKRQVFRVTSKTSGQYTFRCNACWEEFPIIDDLTGLHFGELEVLGIDWDNTRKHGITYYFCLCSCHRICSVCRSSLVGGCQITCGDKALHWSGSNNGNWKGGVTPKLISERNCKEYDDWRNAVYAKDWYTCQCCGATGCKTEKNAHHIKSFKDYDNLKYDVNNGILLCGPCHHIKYQGSFHNVYGTLNNTEDQLENYINTKRQQLGINIPFALPSYLAGERLKPDTIQANA